MKSPSLATYSIAHSPYNAATRSSISFSHAQQPIPWASRHFWDNADIAAVAPGSHSLVHSSLGLAGASKETRLGWVCHIRSTKELLVFSANSAKFRENTPIRSHDRHIT